ALAAVAIPAAAEHGDQSAARQRTQELERALERVRRMRVIDEHGDAALVFDLLEPARNGLERRDAANDRVGLDAHCERRRGGGENVLQIRRADELRGEGYRPIAHLKLASEAVEVAGDVDRVDVPFRVASVAHGVEAERSAFFQELR